MKFHNALSSTILVLILGLSSHGISAQEMVPPRDPALAEAEEFALAREEGSNGALILFIARAPRSALAETARRMLRERGAPDPAPPAGPNGAIIAEFDAARLAGPPALRAFAARYPGHPLAEEARRPFWTGER